MSIYYCLISIRLGIKFNLILNVIFSKIRFYIRIKPTKKLNNFLINKIIVQILHKYSDVITKQFMKFLYFL